VTLRKRFLKLSALVIMALLGGLLLSACGDSPTNTAAPATTVASSATTAPTSATTAAAAGATATKAPTSSNVTLRMITPLFPDADGKKALEDQLLAKFTQETGIKVTVERIPSYTELPQKLTTAFAGGLAPDVFTIGVGWVGDYADQLMPMDGVLDTSDFIESLLETGKHNGKLYGIPYLMDTRLLVYRKDFFKEAGLDPEKPPTSWDELREYAQKLTKRAPDGTIERAGLDVIQTGPHAPEQTRQYWFRFLWQNGGELFSADGKKALFNSPKGVEALEFYTDLIRKQKVTDYGFTTGIQNQSLIAVGKAGMAMVNARTMSMEIGKNPDLKDKIGIIPPLKKERAAEFVGGSYWVVSKNTKHSEEARRLVQFLSEKQNMMVGVKYRKALPAIKSAQSDPYVQEDPILKAGLENLKISRAEGGPKGWLQIRDLFDPALTEALVGKKTPKEALDGLAAKADEILAKASK
jgi:multiple sugar transport system substrate-binding protein